MRRGAALLAAAVALSVPRASHGVRMREEPVSLDALASAAVEDGDGQRVDDAHCTTPAVHDAECAGSVAALRDVRDFVSRTLGAEVVAALQPRDPATGLVEKPAWRLGKVSGPALDLSLFFRKRCPARGGADVTGTTSADIPPKDCLWLAERDSLDDSARRTLTALQCADQVVGTALKNEHYCAGVKPMFDPDKGAEVPVELAMAYRWLESVVSAMRAGVARAEPYAPSCYNKLLLLDRDLAPQLPERREMPDGWPRRGPSLAYARDGSGACRLLAAPTGAVLSAAALDRLVAEPETLFLEWGEVLHDPPAHAPFFFQRTPPTNAAGRPIGPQGKSTSTALSLPGVGTQARCPTSLIRRVRDETTFPIWQAHFPGVEKLPLYLPRKRCEICTTVMMRKIAQATYLCHGLEFYFETCNDVLASILHWRAPCHADMNRGARSLMPHACAQSRRIRRGRAGTPM